MAKSVYSDDVQCRGAGSVLAVYCARVSCASV